ncbi:hypothetical protein KKI24_00505 [bacterium]|nr:hypothetical protein [bacterium]
MYILNIAQLKPCDIFLTKGPNKKIRKAIQLATGGNFSHVAMYLGYSSFIEADLYGVHTGNPQRLNFEDEGDIIVRRSKNELDVSRFEKICFHVKQRTAAPYSILNAILSITKAEGADEPGKHFCSQLISEGFRQVGIDVNSTKETVKITPADFEFSPEFVTVSGVLEELSDEDAAGYLSSINKFDLPSFQQNATNTLMKQLKKILGEYGYNPDTVHPQNSIGTEINIILSKFQV